MTMKFGEAIKQKREQLGMTQQDLAERLFVSRQTICRWENGSRCPDLIMAKKIAMVLGISLDEIIPGEAVQDYTPPKEPPLDISCVKVMLSGIMLLLIGIFFYVADGTGIYMDISGLCFIAGIVVFIVGLFIPMHKQDAIVDDSLPQRQCPQCGKQHDFDYPKCPHCDFDYQKK
jgi:transcriptional regulator with XRE-family HTH domain